MTGTAPTTPDVHSIPHKLLVLAVSQALASGDQPPEELFSDGFESPPS